jgi:hypothetical protein
MERVVSSFFARTPPTIYTQRELKPNSGFGVLFMDRSGSDLGFVRSKVAEISGKMAHGADLLCAIMWW